MHVTSDFTQSYLLHETATALHTASSKSLLQMYSKDPFDISELAVSLRIYKRNDFRKAINEDR